MPTSASPSAGSGQAPAIRTFQLDAGAIGNLSSSVNLFRGDVNLNQTLFTLPGRSQDSGLDVNLAIQYQSNVHQGATTWNREAPTGVLGLGWNLPLTYISATSAGSPVADARQYALFDNGSPNPLVRQTRLPLLFALDGALTGQLQNGQPVPAAVLDGFRSHGLALDDTSQVEGSGPWTLADAAGLQLYTLQVAGNQLQAYDGGELYQLQNYQFWRVIYYPRYERWVVVTDAAVRRSFGAVPGSGSQHIAWQVWWTDASGALLWSGSSTQTQRQARVASAWYLGSVTDRFGNAVQYDYDVVEQAVGAGGLAFTKAIYLKRVTDVFDRVVELAYAEKLYGTGDSDPREYADPHRDVPSNDPSPWQDHYETRYLDQVHVRDPDGTVLFTVQLDYAPRPQLNGPERQVANVTDFGGRLYGDTFKRYLTSIRMIDGAGASQPGMDFGYYLELQAQGAAPGALASITYPEGGTARYSYRLNELDICQRALTVPRPAAVPAGASPRVYFGGDYAVVCYYNQSSLELSLQVYTWAGSWLPWQLDPASALIDSQGLDLSTLSVLADQDVLALHFKRVSQAQQAIYVFQRDPARAGQWLPATIDGKTSAPNQPPLTYSSAGVDLSFVGGASFFVVAQMHSDGSSFGYDLVTWRWPDRAWTRQTIATSGYSWLTGERDWYAVLDGQHVLTVHALGSDLAWTHGAPVTVNGLFGNDPTTVALVSGSGMLAISNLQSANSQQNTYQVWLAQFNAGYAITLSSFGPFTDDFGPGNPPTTWTPRIVEDTLVAINSHLLRFDGVAWLANEQLNPGIPDAGRAQRYAFGPDYAVQIIVPTNGVGEAQALVLGFDPTRDSSSWSATPVAPRQPLSPQDTGAANWPTAGGSNYAVIGPYLYSRGTHGDWAAVVSQDALANLEQLTSAGNSHLLFDSQSLVNDAPTFLAWTAVDGSTTQQVDALILSNGQVHGSTVPFADQRIVTPGRDGVSGPGVAPGGPDTFVAYPATAANFNSAQQIVLHRHTSDAVSGPVLHYAVAGLVIDDGYQEPMPSAFVPDGSSAGCSPDGQVVKYFQSTVYPGTADPQNPRYGRAVSYYLNGLNDLSGDNAFNMLDGMLLRTETYDRAGALKEASASTYKVWQQIAPDPSDPAAAVVALHGGWVTPITQTSLRDGVTTTQTTGNLAAGFSAPFTPSTITQATTSYGGAGEFATFTQTSSYGVQIDAGLRAINALDDPAEQRSTRGVASATTVVQALASTYTNWPSTLGTNVRCSAGEASFGLLDAASSAFPYGSYQPGDTPAGWVLAGRTTARTGFGQERESVDALGVPTATIFARDALFAIARVVNAAVTGAAYLGFQPYEDDRPWTPQGLTYDTNRARTGVRSAVLPAGSGASLSTTVTARNADCPYLVGCWYFTPAGYVAGSGSGWTATVRIDGVAQPPVFVAFDDTAGAWDYRSFPVPLTGAGVGSQITVELALRNTGSADVLLDCVLLLPLVNSLTARTFDAATHQVSATMDAGGRTSQTLFDQAWQPTLSIGASGQVRELAQRFQSRKGSINGQFDPACPNAELTLHPASGGIAETFRDGADWRTRWSASPASDWAEGEGVLSHGAAATGTLDWLGTITASSYAVYFELQPASGAEVAVAAGDVQVRWAGSGYQGGQGGGSWTALAAPPQLARHWLLVVGDGVVLFFGDGQLIFSERTRPQGSAIRVSAGTAAVQLRHLAVLSEVRLGLSWNDAAARQRQVQQLKGDDSLVTEIVFDPVGRQIATTRNAPGSFGSGATLKPLQYSDGFLHVDAFLATLDSTWLMTGDIADYYRGQSDGSTTRSDDQGYPYRGIRYEDSPRSVQLETSRPGKPYAIDLTVPASSRLTLQFAYGSNPPNTGLPAGQYFQNTFTSPMKTASVQLNDQLGQQVGMRYLDAGGALLARTEGLRDYTDAGGPQTTLTTRLPNATTAGPQSDPARYVELSSADGLQRPTLMSDPDSGETAFISDSAGRLRFVRPQQGQGEAWFLYYKYDPLGRMVEEGTTEHAWDRAVLQPLADDPAWPPASAATPALVTAYDGDGWLPEAIGKKVRNTTYNPAPAGDPGAGALTVIESFGYDRTGQIVSVRQETSGALASDGTLGYRYNVLGEIVTLLLPAGASPAALYYRYDDQGKVSTLGSAAGAADIGAYTWTADGDVRTETLAAGAWTQSISYGSPGWAVTLSTRNAAGDQGLAFDYVYAADGSLDSRQVSYDFPQAQQRYSDSYGYDGQRRLLSSNGDLKEAITQYDPNGNIWGADQGGALQSFPTVAGSDRLASVTLSGVTSSVAYNARGQLTAGLDRTLDYDRASNMTTRVAGSSATLRLAYGASQQRVLKHSSAGSDTVYFYGASQVPVAVLKDGAWTVLVQGPLGLAAALGSRQLYPLKDTTRSTWALVDATGLVARWAYLPFGQLADASDPSSTGFSSLFQAQEWDAEVGLYNFKARLYDPVLRRFLSPDPARQFASLYVFAGDNPLTATDPSGEISVWAQVGIGAALVVVTAIGFGLTLFTAGGSDVAAASIDAALLGAEGAAEGAALVGEGVAAAAAEGAVAGAAEGAAAAGVAEGAAAAAGVEGAAAAGASEVAAGASVAETAAATSSLSSTLTTLGVNTLGSTIMGAGVSGLEYDISHGRDFTAKGFFEAMGIGAASGLVSGGLGGAGALGAKALTSGITGAAGVAARMGAMALVKGVVGAISSDVSTVLTNVAAHQPWYQGLAKSTLVGGAKGAATGAASSAASSAWAGRTDIARMAGVSDQTLQRLGTLVDRVQSAATSTDAYVVYGLAAFALVDGYLIWGASTDFKG